jgi:SRSO17 transposase
MAYVSKKGHALIDARLYLPHEWTKDRARMKAAGVPNGTKFRTRHELALEMLDGHGKTLRHGWVAGDDEMGRSSRFRLKLRGLNERYLLAVPSNTLIRDLDEPPPEYSGRGRRPMSPFRRLDRWRAALPDAAWARVDVRDGEKGPLVLEVVKRRVQARTETGGTAPEELLFVTRELLSDGTYKHDYYFSIADPQVTLMELAWVAKAAHRIEECLENAKGEAGLADYPVRTWTAWGRHQTLSLLAAWFLNQETRRKKNPDPGDDFAADASVDRRDHRGASEDERSGNVVPQKYALAASNRTSEVVSPQVT